MPNPAGVDLGDLQTLILELQDIVDSNPGTPLADKVADALAKAETALDELEKSPADSQAALGNIEGAVGDLEAVVSDGLLDPGVGADLMDRFAEVARVLAAEAIDAAIAAGGDPGEIADAQQFRADGDSLRASQAFKDSINQYKVALVEAKSALEQE